MLSAPAANAADRVGVCHRTGGDHHPYTFQKVAANSTALQAHRDHQVDDGSAGEDKHWKAAGSWHGVDHAAGAFKPDYVQGDLGVPTDLDTFRTWCLSGLDDDDTVDTDFTPVAPDFEANGACGVPGWVSEPATTGISYTIEPGDWEVTAGTHTVTASVVDRGTFLTDDTGAWTIAANRKSATFQVALGEYAGPCPSKVTPAQPSASANNCTTPGHLVLPDAAGDGYSWTGQTTDGPGDHLVTAVADTGHELQGQVQWSVHVRAAGEGLTTCGGGTPDPQPTLVTPNYPSATEADCSRRGQLVVPAQPAGVVTTRSGAVPGDVTFTFSPAAGYAFPAGTDTEVSVTVAKRLSGEECILGVESVKPTPHTTKPKPQPTKSKPKPRDRAPIVLGTQAAVPTAVDAGLAGLPGATVSPTSSPRLAQALVAGGLLLLVAGGSMGLGRRPRGAHES